VAADMPAANPSIPRSYDDARAAITPLIVETLAYLTDGCLLSLQEEPVLIPRKIVDDILSASIPIFVVAGDWGQGKSFTGKLIYRLSQQLLQSGSAYKYYVTYIPLSIVYSKVNKNYENFVTNFYGSARALSKESLPADARKFLSIIIPIIFSPNTVKKLGINEILTTLPQSCDLVADDYAGSFLDMATSVLSKIDSKFIIILDELEDVEGIFSINELGKVLYLFRIIYDIALNKGIIHFPTIVLLLQEYARADFTTKLLDQLRTQQDISRTFGVIGNIRTLDPITKDDMKKYISDLLNRVLGEQAKKLFTEKSIENIVQEIEKMNLNNTRLRIALIRQILSNIIARYIAMYPDFVNELQRWRPHEIVKNRILEKIFSEINITTPPSSFEIGLPRELSDILSGKFDRISKYADKLSEITAKEIRRIYGNRALQPSPISRARGYKAYEVLIKGERGGIALRLIVWARLTDINVRRLDRRKILSKFHLTEQDARTPPTKILLVYTPNVKWISRLQAALHDLIVPLPIEDGLTLAAILASTPDTSGSELTRGLHQEFKEVLRKIYEEKYVNRIREIIEDILRHR
jgi:hypothetical protein